MKKFCSLLFLAACFSYASAEGLTRAAADSVCRALNSAYYHAVAKRYSVMWQNRLLRDGSLSMPFSCEVRGERPADGYSVWISLHGGGNTTPLFNDGQWLNQKTLYRPDGIYIAPRAPYDDWDMWFKPAVDRFYHMLVDMCVAYLGANPNKVYLLGYSAGGDGVWRLAPRLADCWAAASMMAGHPGDVSLRNLRNLPFMLWCGADDAAYERNRRNSERAAELDSLQAADPGGYTHEAHLLEGMGHWMNRADTAAIAWMGRHVRNPYPKKIVWRQEEVVKPCFYWLEAPASQLARGCTVEAACADNRIDIARCDYDSLTLWLNDALVDLDRRVEVRYRGRTLFKGRVERSAALAAECIARRGGGAYVFPARVVVAVPREKR